MAGGLKYAPIKELAGKKVMDIVGTNERVVVRTEDGQVWSWNKSELVGLDQLTPQLIFAKDIISVKSNADYTVTLDRWGKMVFQYDPGVAAFFMSHSPPPLMDLGENVTTQFECGSLFLVALTNKGEAFMWGLGWDWPLKHPIKVQIYKEIKWIACNDDLIMFLTVDGDICAFDCRTHRVYSAHTNIAFEKIYCSPSSSFIATTKTGEVYRWEKLTFPRDAAFGLRKGMVYSLLFSDIPWIRRPFQFNLVLIGSSLADAFKDIFQCNCPIMLEWRDIDPDSFDTPENADVIFTFPGGETIHARRSQLSAVSRYMKIRLSARWAPSVEVPIDVYPYRIFYQFIKYLYTGILQPDSLEEALDLVDLAHCHEESGLLYTCLDLIVVRYLNFDTSARLCSLADTYGLVEFGSKVRLYLEDRPTPPPAESV